MAHAELQGSGLFLPDHSWNRLQLHARLGNCFRGPESLCGSDGNHLDDCLRMLPQTDHQRTQIKQ